MKRIGLIVACVVATMSMSAQKFGHIYSDSLLQIMPEYSDAQVQLKSLSDEFQKAIEQKEAELQTKYDDYVQNGQDLPAAIKQNRENEIQSLQQNLQQFAVSIQDELDKEQQALIAPILEKARLAIEAVGKKNGFTYVFDASIGILLFENGENIMPLVKTELGL